MTALVLIGPMGAGKSSIGRRVAKHLGVPFYDTDTAVVREHGPIADLFVTQGEARFRQLERQAVQAALASNGVVSLGGGAVLDADTRGDLAHHRVVLLTVTPQVVAGRLRGAARPLLATRPLLEADPIARWTEIYRVRKPLYDELADVTFDTSSGPLADVVTAVAAWAQHQQEESR